MELHREFHVINQANMEREAAFKTESVFVLGNKAEKVLAGHLTMLSLSFPVCKMELIIVLISSGCSKD